MNPEIVQDKFTQQLHYTHSEVWQTPICLVFGHKFQWKRSISPSNLIGF